LRFGQDGGWWRFADIPQEPLMFWSRKPKIPTPQEAYEAKLREVRDAQRAGDIVRAAELNEEAEALLRRLEPPGPGGAYPSG
jgi:hypothetical protein